MPTVTLNLYDQFRRKQVSGEGAVDLNALTTKCLLVSGSYTPNQNTHDFEDDLGATEMASGGGYTTGGNTMANMTDTVDGSGNVTVDFDDPATWTENASGFSTARRAIIYVDRGGAASANELIGYTDDFGSDQGNTTGDFSIAVNASGLYTSAR